MSRCQSRWGTRASRWSVAGAALLVALALAACRGGDDGHDHSSEHPPGHDHHDEGHGHGDTPVVRITRWSERCELFAEHTVAVAGQPVEVLVHLTVLDDFRPLTDASLALELDAAPGAEPAEPGAAGAPAGIRASAAAPERPGIFELAFTPARPGTYRGRLVITGSVEDVFDGIELRVFDDAHDATHAASSDEHGDEVELLKEQQWGVPFATAFTAEGTLVPSIEVAGVVATPPGGLAEVGAAVAGRVVTPAGGLPRPGDTVRKGQVLATLAPAPSSPEEAARAGLAVAEAEARASAARAALERARRLIGDQAISQRELDDAAREAAVAEEAVRAAHRARALSAGAGAGTGAWRLVAPIAGTIEEVRATPGAAVSPGDVLFRVVDTRELWIRARVPEQDAARLRGDRDAGFQIAGLDEWLPIRVTGDRPSASLVTVGRTVDATSRTVEVIYALKAPDPRLRVGGLVRVALPAGPDFTGVVAPHAAIVDEGGRQVVYVQVDGEHFEERIVRTGPRAGHLTGISHGLAAGERVVTRGAHIVRLAARQRAGGDAHGHIH